jgi:transposase-like protein
VIGEVYKITPKPGSTTRQGVWKCKGCRKQFSVTVKTIFSDSKIPLHKWLFAIHLLCASKKGMSAHQLHRMLGVTYKSAWFMAHRIRYAMQQEPLSSKLDGVVEIDETYIGGKLKRSNNPSNTPAKDPDGIEVKTRGLGRGINPRANKATVLSFVQRGGKVRSYHLDRVTHETLRPVLAEMLHDSMHVMTDSATVLRFTSQTWKHDMVSHSAGEYVRYENGVCVTTNTVESFFNILKRGVNGTYHHVSKTHLHRYLAEFDFRYNGREVSDVERTLAAITGADGKRLMYRDSSRAS